MARVDPAASRPLTGALAVWVKTPGVSPVKTRLAEGIGAAAAEQFYRLATGAVAEVVRQAAERFGGIAPFWAVAEPGGQTAWTGFPTVPQGTGGLGTRLSHVYDTLLARYPWVIFIGGDAPQVTPEALGEAARLAASGDWVLGPADDGGFYLFAGSRPLPRGLWENVPYSAADTGQLLADALRSLAPVRTLPPLFDVDTVAELRQLATVLRTQKALLPAQRALLHWMERSR